MVSESPETGYGRKYQRTAEIESRLSHGLDISERYQKETDFVIRSANLEFDEGDKVLDLASGVGGHSRLLAEKLSVSVDARDYEEDLVAAGQRELDNVSEAVRDRVNIAWGDMGNALESVPGGTRYKMITILGSSFMYLGTKEAHQKALNDYYHLLEPGGKLVLQFRERKGQADLEAQQRLRQELNVDGFLQEATGRHNEFGEFAEQGEKVYVMKDTRRGDGFYFYHVPVEADSNTIWKDARPEEGLPEGWYDDDDVAHSAFGRAYFDENGLEEDVGPAHVNDYMTENGYNKALKAMIEKAGFQNVHLDREPLSPDESWWQFAVVAEKPLDSET